MTVDPGRQGMEFLWAALLGISLLWKVYYDLPYLRQGSSLFWEYLDFTLVL